MDGCSADGGTCVRWSHVISNNNNNNNNYYYNNNYNNNNNNNNTRDLVIIGNDYSEAHTTIIHFTDQYPVCCFKLYAIWCFTLMAVYISRTNGYSAIATSAIM